jgi:hypothetical protein
MTEFEWIGILVGLPWFAVIVVAALWAGADGHARERTSD